MLRFRKVHLLFVLVAVVAALTALMAGPVSAGGTLCGPDQNLPGTTDDAQAWKISFEVGIRLLLSFFTTTLDVSKMATQAAQAFRAFPDPCELLQAILKLILDLVIATDETLKLVNAHNLMGIKKKEGEEEEHPNLKLVDAVFSPLRNLSVPLKAVDRCRQGY